MRKGYKYKYQTLEYKLWVLEKCFKIRDEKRANAVWDDIHDLPQDPDPELSKMKKRT